LAPDLCLYILDVLEDFLAFDFVFYNQLLADFVDFREWSLKVVVDCLVSDLFKFLLQRILVIFGLLRNDLDLNQVAILFIMFKIFTAYIAFSIIVSMIFVKLNLVSDVEGFSSNDFFQAESGLLFIMGLRKL